MKNFQARRKNMTSYDYLFKRAKGVLKARYNIELTEPQWSEVEPFLSAQLVTILKQEKIKQEEIKYYLELLKRQNPTKFYLLELDLIKEIRKNQKKEQIPTIRKISEPQITVKDKDRDDSEHDDTTGFIYY